MLKFQKYPKREEIRYFCFTTETDKEAGLIKHHWEFNLLK